MTRELRLPAERIGNTMFDKDGITYYEILDCPELGYATIDYLWAVKSNGVVAFTDKTIFAPLNHIHFALYSGNSTISVDTDPILIKADSPAKDLRVKLGGNSIKTSPSGTGQQVYADGFVEWSMAANKENIEPIPDAESVFVSVTAKQYTIAGAQRFGFVVEDLPSKLTHSSIDENNKIERGVSIGGMLAYLWEFVGKLAARVAALEAKK